MVGTERIPAPVRQRSDPAQGGRGGEAVGIPVAVTLVEAPACHLCEQAKSTLACLALSYPITVHVVEIDAERGRALMRQHRAPMSPLVLLDGQYFSSGRLPLRKLERRLQALRGETDG